MFRWHGRHGSGVVADVTEAVVSIDGVVAVNLVVDSVVTLGDTGGVTAVVCDLGRHSQHNPLLVGVTESNTTISSFSEHSHSSRVSFVTTSPTSLQNLTRH
jgi:hypothetical protein